MTQEELNSWWNGIPPKLAAWVHFSYAACLTMEGTYPKMHPMIQHAVSSEGYWAGNDPTSVYARNIVLNDIVNAAVLDFREAYGAAFDEVGMTDLTLVPLSCVNHIYAAIYYNIAIKLNLSYYDVTGGTAKPVSGIFLDGWRESAIYRRHVTTMRNVYRDEISTVADSLGTPIYIPRTERSERSL